MIKIFSTENSIDDWKKNYFIVLYIHIVPSFVWFLNFKFLDDEVFLADRQA